MELCALKGKLFPCWDFQQKEIHTYKKIQSVTKRIWLIMFRKALAVCAKNKMGKILSFWMWKQMIYSYHCASKGYTKFCNFRSKHWQTSLPQYKCPNVTNLKCMQNDKSESRILKMAQSVFNHCVEHRKVYWHWLQLACLKQVHLYYHVLYHAALLLPSHLHFCFPLQFPLLP